MELLLPAAINNNFISFEKFHPIDTPIRFILYEVGLVACEVLKEYGGVQKLFRTHKSLQAQGQGCDRQRVPPRERGGVVE